MFHFYLKACMFAVCLFLTPVAVFADNVDILSTEAAEMLKTPVDNRVIIDVRTPAEFAKGHIKNAQVIDFKASDFKEKISQLDKDAPHILLCHSGKRSAGALEIMEALGFTNVQHMKDGMVGWEANNFEVLVTP